MLKRFSHFFACLLLVLMPLQALATANMLVCNSMMQSQTAKQSVNAMPCHQHMTNSATSSEAKLGNSQPSPCKASCASICANVCAMIAMPSSIQSTFALNFIQLFDFNSQTYASITQPNLQRPPILLS